MTVPNAHELAVTHDGRPRTSRVAPGTRCDRRPRAPRHHRNDPARPTPDTLQPPRGEAAHRRRSGPRKWRSLDKGLRDEDRRSVGPGNRRPQWTSGTRCAAFEGPGAGVAVIDHSRGRDRANAAYPGRPPGSTSRVLALGEPGPQARPAPARGCGGLNRIRSACDVTERPRHRARIPRSAAEARSRPARVVHAELFVPSFRTRTSRKAPPTAAAL